MGRGVQVGVGVIGRPGVKVHVGGKMAARCGAVGDTRGAGAAQALSAAMAMNSPLSHLIIEIIPRGRRQPISPPAPIGQRPSAVIHALSPGTGSTAEGLEDVGGSSGGIGSSGGATGCGAGAAGCAGLFHSR